jgi:hypothetical protein
MGGLGNRDHEGKQPGVEIEGDIPCEPSAVTNCSTPQMLGGVGIVHLENLQDFLLTSNGAFVIDRATKSEASQIISLIPLNSMSCTHGSPEFPVIYKDLKGREHQLRAADVLEFADMPSNRASMFGQGNAAAARAYKSIYKLACIKQIDKVAGADLRGASGEWPYDVQLRCTRANQCPETMPTWARSWRPSQGKPLLAWRPFPWLISLTISTARMNWILRC